MITRSISRRNKAAKEAVITNLRDTVFSTPFVPIIAPYLSYNDVILLSGAFPLFKHELFCWRRQVLDAALNAHRFTWSQCSEMEEFTKRLKRYFTYGRTEASDVAERISYFMRTRNEPKIRRKYLIDKLKEKNLILRSDSHLCKIFIDATEDIDIEEVVSIMELTRKQFAIHHVVWSENHLRVERILRNAVYKDGKSWNQALKLATDEIDDSVLLDYDSPVSWESWDDYDDDRRPRRRSWY